MEITKHDDLHSVKKQTTQVSYYKYKPRLADNQSSAFGVGNDCLKLITHLDIIYFLFDFCLTVHHRYITIDIFVNCNWVVTRWQ